MKKNGFTVIEVALVLAIAGMIMLLAFLALPGLQRSQRDSTRKDDIMRLADSIKRFQSNNNRGALPSSTDLSGFAEKYLDSNFADPKGDKYVLVWDSLEGKPSNKIDAKNNPKIVFVVSAKCGDENKAVYSNNNRKAVLLYKLEVGGTFCFEL